MDKNIKILHTEWSDGWGGQEIRIVAESKEFIKRGYEVIIACQTRSILYKKATKENIAVLPIKLNKGLNIITIFKLVKFIKKNNIDIVHTHSSVDSRTAGIAAKIAGVKVVRSRHISVPISTSKLTYFQYTKLADKIIASGKFIKDMMIHRNHFPRHMIASAPAGIDTTQFNLHRDLPNIKEQYKLNNTFLVGIVSVLRSWKGHIYLIEAIDLLKEKIPNIHLIIVGDGPQKDNITQQIQELNLEQHITLAGHHKDPAPFYKAMEIMILPSYAGEATSQVLPQAMAMQTPIIGTHAGGLAEVVIDEKTGLKIATQDSQSIADAILRLYKNPNFAQELATNGYNHTMDNFTFKKMIDITEGVYQEINQ
jgi:glycosyltransferase involved in cell wall biosynthesis